VRPVQLMPPQGIHQEETLEDSLRNRPSAIRSVKSYLFVVLEGDRPLAGGARFSLEGIDEVLIARGQDRGASRETSNGVRRLTIRLPSASLSALHARLRRTLRGWLIEDAHSKNGSFLNGQRVEQAVLEPDDLLDVGHVFLTIGAFAERDDAPSRDLDGAHPPDQAALATLVPPLEAELAELARLARSSLTILLWGETGTGKEVLARAIHAMSGRSGPFVAINCGTLTDGLAESQLFGHVRGAFSGAVGNAVGFIRAAQGGTLLLDEVGDLGGPAQGALLRVLQEREIVPVGKARAESVDVRFVATSPRPLDPAIGGEAFRSDLFSRLSGFVYAMTPLRRRRQDLGVLLAALLRKARVLEADRPRISPQMALALLRHDWPLNIRELEQALLRAWTLADGGMMDITAPLLPAALEAQRASELILSQAEHEARGEVLEALTATHGNVSEAARMLGKGRVQLHRLIRRLRIDARAFRA
jgi:DNA-binding NtrC family response regulator